MKYRIALLLFWLLSPLALGAHGGHSNLEFVENQGQWPQPFLYKADARNGQIYVEKDGFTFVLADRKNSEIKHSMKTGQLAGPQTLRFHAYRLRFLKAESPRSVTGSKAYSHYYNYFLGKDSSRWKTGIHPVRVLDIQGLYPGIDLRLSSESGQLKYDLILEPGADPDQIVLDYEGADRIRVQGGRLRIQTSVGEVWESQPVAFQYGEGGRVEIECRYKVRGNQVRYDFPSGYDPSRQLIIDPHVEFASYTGSTADNWGFTATYDDQGNLYAGGIVDDTGYPTTTGAYDRTYNGGGTGGNNMGMESDISISKFNAAGNALLYSTYIGGSENDQPHSLIVDQNNQLIIAGRTYSDDYPTLNGYKNSRTGNDADIILTKLNASGTALLGSTYFGGSQDDGVNIASEWGVTNSLLKKSYSDDSRSEVIVDDQGNIYLASCTKSPGLPVNGSLSGPQDGLILKFSPNLNSLIWGTYFGGSGHDATYVIALNQDQSKFYVAGGVTADPGIPGSATNGAYDPSYNGGIDGFILRFENSPPYAMDRASFLGTPDYDQVFGIQVDLNDQVYALGHTLGASYPSNTPFQQTGAPQFITKLDADLSTMVFSTRFGKPNATVVDMSPVALLVDTCENIYVSGWGGMVAGNGGNISGMPIHFGSNPPTPAGILSTTTADAGDFYFMVLRKDATGILFGGYYGSGSVGEHVDGGTSRFDKNGVIYQAICGCGGATSPLPMTPGSYSNVLGSTNCNVAVIKIAFNFGSVSAKAQANPSTTVCTGDPIQFTNQSTNGVQYEWDFGDGNTSTQMNPTHTYTTGGSYSVRLIVINADACRPRDTTFLTIVVNDNRVKADFDTEVINACKPYEASFTNTSNPGTGNPSYRWYFGYPGGQFNGFDPGTHTFPDTGLYEIMLIVTDPTACNSPDTIIKTLYFNSYDVEGDMEVSDHCLGDTIQFRSVTAYATEYYWEFGDGQGSLDPHPSHLYDSPGIYRVMFVASNPGSCNGYDTTYRELEVMPKPSADFVFGPSPPVTNEPIQFTNRSQRADRYNWDFGDLTGSSLTNPQHLYKRTGIYEVCLTAISLDGCQDRICKNVEADILQLVDIPTGFSPNGDGKNDILYVRGAAIETFHLRIYNRWGELVFQVHASEANDPAYGWDGEHRGTKQEVESYGYVLEGLFVDGTPFQKSGNITLLR